MGIVQSFKLLDITYGIVSLWIHLMLVTRKVVSPSIIQPVVTFGSPFVFCGGQKILYELVLDENHTHCIMMHRDIVPRVFSFNYTNHVAVVLKCLNGSNRSHPCLLKNVSIITISVLPKALIEKSDSIGNQSTPPT